MYSKMLILRFPKTEVQKPIVCYLAKDFDLTFNILNATVLPRKEGVMVLELSGEQKDFQKGVEYLRGRGVRVQSAGEEIDRDADRCTHCGACTAVCPTGALLVKRPEMTVPFDAEKCSVCQLCVAACPPRAIRVTPINRSVFI
ncbi:NIL domain-containing protein [Thermodesulfobacteriota bacterium]